VRRLFTPKKPAILRIWDEEALEYSLGGGGLISAAAGDSLAYTNFAARVSLDSTHIPYYKTLLNGLTTDGLFNSDGTTDFFDVLYIFAAQDTATALTNLVSSSFTGTANGGPTFNADRGFTGVDASLTVFIDTGFNPVTASSPKFVQNSAHQSAWSDTNLQASASGGVAIGSRNGTTYFSETFPRYSDGNAYYRINDGTAGGIVTADATGHYLANRSGAAAQQGYKNAVDQGVTAVASLAPINFTFFILATSNSGSGGLGDANQYTMASLGGSLTATQVTNFYNRLRTYMTSVGVP